MEKKIIIFSLFGCQYCVNLKNKLTEMSIDFTDIDVEKNPDIWDQVVSQTNENVLPTIFIQHSDTNEGEVYVPGINYEEEDEIIEILKNMVLK